MDRATIPVVHRFAALLRVAAAVSITTAALVLPFAYAISTRRFDLLVAGGSAFTVGTLFGWRAPGAANPQLGAGAALLVGIAAALVAGLIPGNGVVFLFPPLQAVAAGFLWATRPEPPRAARDALKLSLSTGLWLGVGMTPALPLSGIITGILTSLLIAPAVELHRVHASRKKGVPASYRLFVALLLMAFALCVAAVVFVHLDEGLGYGEAAVVAGPSMLLVPHVFFGGSRSTVDWCRPRIRLLRDVAECMRALYVPLGAFAIGYLVIVVAFAGIYGTVHRFDPEAFRFAIEAEGHPGIGHWLFMAFYVATSQGLVDIVPQSGAAKLAVGVQLTLCLSWAVVVFAAVMTRVHPVLQKISERNA